MEESKNTSDEDETNVPNEPQYFLCPLCSTDENPYGDISMEALAGHFNFTHTNKKKGGGEKWDDYKPHIQKVAEKPPNLIQREKKKKTSQSTVIKKGGKMSGEDDLNSEVPAELGEADALKGRLRGLIKAFAKLTDDERDALMSEREQLVGFMRTLSAKREVSMTTVREIEAKIDTEIEPVIKTYTNPDENKASDDKSPDRSMTDVRMKAQKLRSRIKIDLANIANLPSKHQDEIMAEKDLLINLNRRLCKDEVTKADIQDIEASYSGSHPFVESIVNKGKKKTKNKDEWDDDDDDDEDWDEMEKEDMKDARRREKILKYQVRQEEYKQRLAELKSSSPTTHHGIPPIQVSQRPRINPETGMIETDENGNPVMEHYYIQQGATGDSMAMTLLTAVLPTLVGNARGKGDGPTTAEIELRLQNERLQFEKILLERDKGRSGDSESSQELREMRAEMRATQEAYHHDQITRLEHDLQRSRQALAQNPLDELFEQKEKLIQLGLVQDAALASEDKQTAYANKVLEETRTLAQKTTSELRGMIEPLAELGRDDMRITLDQKRSRMEREARNEGIAPPQQPKPKQYTEEEKRRKWNKLYHAVEEEEEDI